MTFLEAAEAVLQGAGRPLTVREITQAALERPTSSNARKDSGATMSAALYGAPPETPIRREFMAGRQRAVRGSVRWVYVGPQQ